MFASLGVGPVPPCAGDAVSGAAGAGQTGGQRGTAWLPTALRAAFRSHTLSAAALLFQIYDVLACSDLFVYSPPSPANFPARIAFIHESPPFLSLTRARSHCRREEARTLFPLFKVSRSVPGGQQRAPPPPPCLMSDVCSFPDPLPAAGTVVGDGSTCSSFFSGCL